MLQPMYCYPYTLFWLDPCGRSTPVQGTPVASLVDLETIVLPNNKSSVSTDLRLPTL